MADNTPVTADPNVRVPRAIIAAAQKADEIHKLAYNTPDAPPNGEAPPAASAAPAPQPPPAPPPETAEDWKGRYNSLKGRYDQQQGQIQNQSARLASLESMIASLQHPTARETPPQPKPTPQTKRVRQEEIDEYGEEFVDVVQRAALDAIHPLLNEQERKLREDISKELQKTNSKVTVAEREAASAQHQRLLTYLDNSVANWRVVNKHPKFLNWLGLTDPMSGAIRKNLLNDAVAQGDSSRAASFYRAFLAEEGTSDPAFANGSAPTSTPLNGSTGNGTGKVGLETLAAPGRPAASGTAAPQTVPDNKPIITRAQISAFYANKARGVYSAEEAKQHEEMIFAAQKDGRIR